MGLDGIHHVTAISADAQRAIDFHAGVLGLRLVKTTVNFDAPDMYHLYFGDETGSPGSILTFFEIRGAQRGSRRGRDDLSGPCSGCPRGGLARVLGRAPRRRRAAGGHGRTGRSCRPTPRASACELVVEGRRTARSRTAVAAGIPAEHAIAGIAGVRAHSGRARLHPGDARRAGSRTQGMGRLVTCGAERRGVYLLDERPARAASRARGRCTTSRGPRPTRSTGLGRPGARGRGPADAGHRPAVLPLDLLPRARRRAVRAGHAEPGLRRGRGPGRRSGRSCGCRRSTSPTARGSRSGSRRCDARSGTPPRRRPPPPRGSDDEREDRGRAARPGGGSWRSCTSARGSSSGGGR